MMTTGPGGIPMARSVRIPRLASARLEQARQRGLWASGLPVGGDAALRDTGFAPIGIVTSGTLSWPFAYRSTPAMRSRYAAGSTSLRSVIDDPLTARRAGGFAKDHTDSSKGSLVPDFGWSWQRVVHEHRRHQLFDATLDKLREEAAQLGAHGVIDVKLVVGHRDAVSRRDLPNFELRATGTAVRSPTAPPSERVFTAAATAGQVVQLLRSGRAPTEAVMGIGIVRADLSNATRKVLRAFTVGEVGQFSEAVQKGLELAIADVERQAARWGDLAIGCRTDIDFDRHPGAGLEVEVSILGTATRRFDPGGQVDAVPVMRLQDRAK
jgi:uncharacterized protein YbjQ (UPF0145 family)